VVLNAFALSGKAKLTIDILKQRAYALVPGYEHRRYSKTQILQHGLETVVRGGGDDGKIVAKGEAFKTGQLEAVKQMAEEQKPKLEVSFSPNAERNLEEIEDYIAENGDPDASARVVDQIVDRCEALANMPSSGKARDEIARGLRSATSGMYVIYYRIHKDKIEILRVWHGARDNAALIGEL
jgi:toxin ParE1/3/4